MSTSTQNTEVKRSSWNIALKQWNESNTNKVLGKSGKAKFIIPKKNTPEFDLVKKLSDEIKSSQPPKTRRTAKGARSETGEVVDGNVPVAPKKTRVKKEKVQYEGVIGPPDHPEHPKDEPTTPGIDLDAILKMLASMKTK